MRPIRLDLVGFAAFRDPTTIDFHDTDYFALVGPTGSGKSTVIDAMTFALYGSAPRWGSSKSIQYALAPTTNRATVRLVFDVAGQRYAVAREVRRSGKQIAQKSCLLERYADPQASGELDGDEPTEPLGGDPKAVLERIVDLLGLDFDDFCTCVVLPQGEFEKFLKASVAQRQEILLKLLGAQHYDEIGRRAGRRASDAKVRIDALSGQLAGYDDATEEREAAARARESRLARLHDLVGGEVSDITALLTQRADLAARADRLTAELSLLDAVQAPDGIDDLQRSLAVAEDAYRSASDQERVAGRLVVQAEEALRAGPQRAPLEETMRWHADRRRESARTAAVGEAAEAAAIRLTRADRTAEFSHQRLDAVRAEHDRFRTTRDGAAAARAEIAARIGTLRAVAAPEGVADLDQALDAARSARQNAEQELAAADAALDQADRAISALPERSALSGLLRTIEAYEQTAGQLDALRLGARSAGVECGAASSAVEHALVVVDRARRTVETVRTAAVVADLRPRLRVGRACPVCDQEVRGLPSPAPAPALEAAQHALVDAERCLREAEAAAAAARSRRMSIEAQVTSATERLSEHDRTLLGDLPDHPGGADRDPLRNRSAVDDLLACLDGVIASRAGASQDRAAAAEAMRRAEQAEVRLADVARLDWAALHTARGQLAALGEPPLPAGSLGVAWSELVGWATGAADRLASDDLPAAQATVRAAEQHLARAADQLRSTEDADRSAREELTAATVAEDKARSARIDLAHRLGELAASLAGRPTEPEARRLLDEHERLEKLADSARTAATAAAEARQTAEQDRDLRRADRLTAQSTLRAVRDPLVALGVPIVDEADLSRAWSELGDWARAEAEARRAGLLDIRAELGDLDAALADQVASVLRLLDEQGVPAPPIGELDPAGAGSAGRVGRITTIVELERERARAQTEEIARRRAEADRLRRTIASDVETEQVARTLQQMMSAKRFPQWLADAALDTLVADASASLLRLSNGQFELTHDRGEFFVIDHADADSKRSVRTLSGGETFQASLALALALSEQLSTLAAGGRTTLDSIFLDEGFGTLDPDALEIVAGTLENLAQEDRMVGVITHVTALAERVPVRFEVSRGSRTSSIERVGP